MDVPENSRVGFYSKLQDNFSRIYPSTNISNIDVVKNIEALM
jgi:hypothetical protein